MKRFAVFFTIILPALGLITLFHATTLQASVRPFGSGTMFTVNSTTDAPDVDPGDGVCETAVGNNECTLRAAINETNALSTVDTVVLPTNIYTLTYGLPPDFEGVDLEILDDLTLVGDGDQNTIVSSDIFVGIFRITGAMSVTLQDFTIRDGQALLTPC